MGATSRNEKQNSMPSPAFGSRRHLLILSLRKTTFGLDPCENATIVVILVITIPIPPSVPPLLISQCIHFRRYRSWVRDALLPASSRKGCVINGQTTEARNKMGTPPPSQPPPTPSTTKDAGRPRLGPLTDRLPTLKPEAQDRERSGRAQQDRSPSISMADFEKKTRKVMFFSFFHLK